jgi:hypothetical protein
LNSGLLIYSSFTHSRLLYVLKWIFTEQLGISYSLTSNAEEWKLYDGPKIVYDKGFADTDALRIIPHPLLEQNDIQPQELFINRWKHSTILFYNQPGAAIPFDIFSAVFFFISRYEEYLPNRKDKHGRYAHEQSAAAQFSFLQQPVVDEWLLNFGRTLEMKTGLKSRPKSIQFLPSYDIDIAWKYQYKTGKRKWGGHVRDLLNFNFADIAERKAVLKDKKKDPYDSFSWLDEVHERFALQPQYFILLGQLSEFDKNADPSLPAMQQLMQDISGKYDVGIHPSYLSHESADVLTDEINILAKATHKPVRKSRQHYIKFTLPETYQQLIAAGIEDDYSMGYASCNGFRAGTSNAFPWYDLSREQETSLRVHPFAFMEATGKFYNHHTPAEAFKEWERLWHAVKAVNGTFISIWHNHILGTHPESKGWRELYIKTIEVTQR